MVLRLYLFIPLITFLLNDLGIMAESSCYGANSVHVPDEQSDSNSNICTALTIYDEKSQYPLDAFAQKFKIIEIGDRRYKLRQSWSSVGVAGVVWDAAIVLSEYLTANPEIVRGKRILELGAGTGLPSMVAVDLGALTVASTDMASAIPLLKRNILGNLHSAQHSKIEIRELMWGRSNTEELMGESPFKAYDLVMGADVVYNEDVFNDLLETFSTVVKISKEHGVTTKIILSMRFRYERDGKFLRMLKEVFEVVDEIHFDAQRDIHVYSCEKLI